MFERDKARARPETWRDGRVGTYCHPWGLGLRLLLEVGVDAAEHSLVGDDEDVLGPLQLHDDGLQADHDIAIRLAAAVSVVVLVVIAGFKVFRVLVFDVGVRKPVTNTSVQLIQSLPLELVIMGWEMSGS